METLATVYHGPVGEVAEERNEIDDVGDGASAVHEFTRVLEPVSDEGVVDAVRASTECNRQDIV